MVSVQETTEAKTENQRTWGKKSKSRSRGYRLPSQSHLGMDEISAKE